MAMSLQEQKRKQEWYRMVEEKLYKAGLIPRTNVLHEGTQNPEHPEFALHFRGEMDMADFDNGTSSYHTSLTNNFYRVDFCPIVETEHPEHFIFPMRLRVYFAGDLWNSYTIEAFIIPDKRIPHEPELAFLGTPFNTERRFYHWRDNKPVPGEFYHAAMTLIEADKLVRKMYPGYCLIINRPELEVPDELPEPFKYKVPECFLEQEKIRNSGHLPHWSQRKSPVS